MYVDDTLFYSPKTEYIDEVIEPLKNIDMDLEVEGEVAGFLEVHIVHDQQAGRITLMQTGLIKRIVEAVDTLHLPIKHTPALSKPLVKDRDSEPIDSTFNYSSVIGMLQYLQNHT
jgi:hypothetical protein